MSATKMKLELVQVVSNLNYLFPSVNMSTVKTFLQNAKAVP